VYKSIGTVPNMQNVWVGSMYTLCTC